MEFKYAVIGKTLYGTEKDDKFSDERLSSILLGTSSPLFDELTLLSKDKSAKFTFKSEKDLVYEYFLLLSSAHECIVEKRNNKTSYQGPSPDEIALVETACT